MIWLIGTTIVILSVFAGYVLGGGHLGVLWQPFEFLIIAGASFGALLTACGKTTVKAIPGALGDLYRGARYDKAAYLELILLLYTLFKIAKTKGALVLESHVENPEESSVFSQFPGFMKNKKAVVFLCDYLRLLTMGTEDPNEIEDLLDEELETMHTELSIIPNAMQLIADGMPALGIVAAVLGVIHTMGFIAEPPEVLGGLIGAALTGTFLGILLSYGFLGPMGNGIRAVYAEDVKYFECIKSGLLAHLHGFAPSLSVEFARKSLYSAVRPTFYEVEEAIAAIPAANT